MSNETKFMNGLIVKKKRDNAPDFVKCHLSMKVDELIATLQEHSKDGWVNGDILMSKAGKLYCKIDDWEPTQGQAATAGIADARQAAQPEGGGDWGSDVPFSNYEYRTLA